MAFLTDRSFEAETPFGLVFTHFRPHPHLKSDIIYAHFLKQKKSPGKPDDERVKLLLATNSQTVFCGWTRFRYSPLTYNLHTCKYIRVDMVGTNRNKVLTL